MGDFTSDSLSDALTENRILHRELKATREQLQEWKDKPAKALPRLVVCAILIRNGKVLLERRAPSGVAGLDGKWDLPGGKVECGEEPFIYGPALPREVLEMQQFYTQHFQRACVAWGIKG